jgi:hypothetical protein
LVWIGILFAMYAFNVFLHLPALVNADYFMNSDEAFVANNLIRILEGGSFNFYYEHNRYVGVLVDFTAAPFIYFFGPTSLAFKLTNIFVYSLYVGSMCLLARQFGLFVVFALAFFLLLPPPSILDISLSFIPHMMVGFLANLCFLIYLKIEKSGGGGRHFFCLGFLMGFSIYIYTYAVLLITSLALLFVLTRKNWDRLRFQITFSTLKSLFQNLSVRQRFIRFLDCLIVVFFLAIVFAYTFGGFGLDIAGVTLFQINNLYRPLGQFAILLLLRIGLDRNAFAEAKSHLMDCWLSLAGKMRQWILLGMAGFFLGLSPRIASILTGETKRGGQGFDMDFMPLRLIKHAWILVTHDIPELLGILDPIKNFIDRPFEESTSSLLFVLALIIAGTFLFVLRFLFQNNKDLFIRIFHLKKIEFSPHLFFIIFPIVIIFANIATQSGPLVRYLFPMYGAALFWLSLFLKSQWKKGVIFVPTFMVVWVIFFSVTLYQNYVERGMLNGDKVVRLAPDAAYEVITFAKENDIPLVYGGVNVFTISFLSERTLPVAENSRSPRSKIRNKKAESVQEFAVVARKEALVDSILESYLVENEIAHQKSVLEHHVIFWDFSGNREAIDALRTFFP